MAKKCLIYETLNNVKELLNIQKESNGLMKLSGVFGVCGVRNNNQRIYETSNYSKMVTEMKDRISKTGGIPGELEHPQSMNITLENVSHKITDINIDDNGVVTGTIELLNTPKGKLAQAIVEGGLPLFISSRATGNVDRNNGAVTLERISTYDLVGSPGFSQAELHLNENQVAESINESVYFIADKVDEELETNKDNNENNEDMEILERLEALEARIEELEETNESLQEQLDEKENFNLKSLADGIQKWIVEEYSPMVQNWIVEEYGESVRNEIVDEATENAIDESKQNFIDDMAPKIEKWIVEEFAPEIQNWIVEQYSPEIQNWSFEQLAPGIQNWIIEEFAPEVENWLNESYSEKIGGQITEAVKANNKTSLSSINETLQMLDNLEVSKPKYPGKSIITENLEEPKFIQDMPADIRVKWDMAPAEVKESVCRRARLYNFVNEDAIERFWANVNLDEIKPITNIYEGLQGITDERERNIRAAFRRHRNKF